MATLRLPEDWMAETFKRTCECGSKTFHLGLEDIDTIPLSMPAYQRVTCTACGRYSIQTVSSEQDGPKTEQK